jgi:hypothetical protein
MKQWMSMMIGLVVCISTAYPASAEVVELGKGHVTRYAVTDTAGGGDAIVTGELVSGSGAGVRVAVAGRAQEASWSLAEARSVQQLLGHMLAMSGPSDPQPQASAATASTDTAPEAAADPPPPDAGGDKPSGDAPVADEPTGKKSHLGMNLADVTYYTRAWVFTELMLQSDAWRKNGTGHIFKAGQAPPGQYICTWAGDGAVRFSGDATANQTSPNSAAVVISTGNEGVNMQKSGGVTDVNLIRIEHETRTSPFQPEYLSQLMPFKVLRFMDWGNTNNSDLEHWAGRPRKGQQTQAGSDGVAIEYMIALCNELGADPWLCIPHKADDDYIRRYAELVRDRLHPDAKVYLEYSNEVWNGQFKQHGYIKQISGGDSFSDGFFDAWAERCRRTFDIWAEVFGDEAGDRLVRVAAVQLANPWVAKQLLSRLDGQFDAVAPSAYFGITPKQGQKLNITTTVDDVLDLCEQNIRNDNRDWFNRHGDLARQWSSKLGRPIRLISYEAGQHLTAHGDGNLTYYDALIDAQSHPRIYGLYLLNMRLFEQAGGDLFVAFNDVSRPGKFGSWGHLEYQNQPTEDAPKYKALIEYPSLHQ